MVSEGAGEESATRAPLFSQSDNAWSAQPLPAIFCPRRIPASHLATGSLAVPPR